MKKCPNSRLSSHCGVCADESRLSAHFIQLGIRAGQSVLAEGQIKSCQPCRLRLDAQLFLLLLFLHLSSRVLNTGSQLVLYRLKPSQLETRLLVLLYITLWFRRKQWCYFKLFLWTTTGITFIVRGGFLFPAARCYFHTVSFKFRSTSWIIPSDVNRAQCGCGPYTHSFTHSYLLTC